MITPLKGGFPVPRVSGGRHTSLVSGSGHDLGKTGDVDRNVCRITGGILSSHAGPRSNPAVYTPVRNHALYGAVPARHPPGRVMALPSRARGRGDLTASRAARRARAALDEEVLPCHPVRSYPAYAGWSPSPPA
ncbi:hypothetical protein GCM10020001_093000 [Nonomuraea salmonea]